jgi:hypothetical protein
MSTFFRLALGQISQPRKSKHFFNGLLKIPPNPLPLAKKAFTSNNLKGITHEATWQQIYVSHFIGRGSLHHFLWV